MELRCGGERRGLRVPRPVRRARHATQTAEVLNTAVGQWLPLPLMSTARAPAREHEQPCLRDFRFTEWCGELASRCYPHARVA